MTTLYDDGIYKVLQGITTLDEVFRVSKREIVD
jgi:type II secretory ATPase GspE/PulE/Tfp pilus assembly ATPase PilB-like protein